MCASIRLSRISLLISKRSRKSSTVISGGIYLFDLVLFSPGPELSDGPFPDPFDREKVVVRLQVFDRIKIKTGSDESFATWKIFWKIASVSSTVTSTAFV